jgi:hypothetical protein
MMIFIGDKCLHCGADFVLSSGSPWIAAHRKSGAVAFWPVPDGRPN